METTLDSRDTRDASTIAPAADVAVTETTENLSMARNIKLGVFHIGSSMADILASGVWNRVMITELGFAATPISLLLALKYFITPLSIWAGQRSDVTSWRGYRRLPFIWGGRLLMVLSYFLLGLSTVALADSRVPGAEGGALISWVGIIAGFLMFSIGSAFSGTTFISLIYDITPQAQRTRSISVVWFFLIVGFAFAGILFGRLLPTYTREGFLSLFIIAPLIMGAIWFFTILGEEKPTKAMTAEQKAEQTAQRKAAARPFWPDFKTAWANRQTRLFFLFLAMTTLFFYTQDVILEPFGGTVFGMPVSTTSRFSSYWGTLALLGIIGSLVAARRFPKRVNNTSLTRWGVITLVVAFGIMFISAAFQIRALVTIGLIVIGAGLGMWTVGTLGLMMDMTRAWGAGLYLSLWTVSETIARGLGTIAGGVVKDTAYAVLQNNASAYSVVFLFQTVGFALSLYVLAQLSVEKFHQQAPAAEMVMSAGMD